MPDDTALLAKLNQLYRPETFAQVRWRLENLRRLGAHAAAEALRESFIPRMCNLCLTTTAEMLWSACCCPFQPASAGVVA